MTASNRPQDAMPLVSLGLPVYNGESYLPRCLESLLHQSCSDFEVIICDNASSDRTAEIGRDYARSDARIRYIRQAWNIGAPRNFNLAFAESRGRFFKWCAHDDELSPTYLERCLAILKRDSRWIGAHTEVEFTGPSGQPLPFDPIRAAYVDETGRSWVDRASHIAFDHDDPVERFRSVLRGKVWHPVWGLYRRSEMALSGLLRPFWGNDKAFLAEMALRGKIAIVPEPHFRMRCHGASAGQLPFGQVNRWLKGKDEPIRPLAPQLATLRAYCGIIAASPLRWRQKAECAAVLLQASSEKLSSDSFVGLGSIRASLGLDRKARS